MSDIDTRTGPGEARTRKRRVRQAIYLAVGGLLGGLIGFFTGFFDQGDGNLFDGDWAELTLDPVIALIASGLALVAFLALPLWGFRMIDDFKREWNLIAFSAGMLGVLSGFPVWALLYAGGFVPPPHAFGVWVIGFISMYAGYAYARWLR